MGPELTGGIVAEYRFRPRSCFRATDLFKTGIKAGFQSGEPSLSDDAQAICRASVSHHYFRAKGTSYLARHGQRGLRHTTKIASPLGGHECPNFAHDTLWDRQVEHLHRSECE
jgi:hypothetical protein